MVSSAAMGRARARADARWLWSSAAIGVGILAFGLAVWRLLPGIGFWDTAEFQMVLPVMGTAHPTGYPTYVLVGWLANLLLTPLGEPALRMNVLSAILVGVAIAFSVDLARRLTGSLILGITAGLGFAVTPIMWAIGTHADPHALHIAFVAIILWLLVRWEHAVRGDPIAADPDAAILGPNPTADRLLVAAALVVGLSVGNHSLTLFLGPPILLFVLAVEPGILRRRRFVAANILAFLIPTVLVRFEMILRGGWLRAPFVYANPSTWDGFWYVTLGAQFHSWLTDPFANPGKRLDALAALAANQFGPLAVLVLIAAVVTAFRQPRYLILTGTAMVLTLYFNSVYPDGAIDRYYLGPALIAWTWLVILAGTATDFLTAPGGLLAIGGPPTVARAVRSGGLLVLAGLLLAPSAFAFSQRATLVDDSGDRAAQAWTNDVLRKVEPNAVIVSWWSYSTPLWYAQVIDDLRPDVCIIDDRTRLDFDLGELSQVIDRYVATRPVYLIRNGESELPALTDRFQLTPVPVAVAGNLLRVTPRGAATSPAGLAAAQLSGPRAAALFPSTGLAEIAATREGCP